ncbi:MAG: hypothetical protein KDH88_08820 [Chromatiales bacterium]|nr:hypothetical protein [Chromatiales bacterium]
MKIESAELQLAASHQRVTRSVEREELHLRIGPPDNGERPGRRLALGKDKVEISGEQRADKPSKLARRLDEPLDKMDDLRVSILRKMLEAFTGRKIDVLSPSELQDQLEEAETAEVPAASPPSEQTQQSAGYAIAYDYYSARFEHESTSFNAQGSVRTTDGREIQIDVQLNMSRTFFEEQRLSLRVGDAPKKVDPLVVNFAGNAAELSDTRFAFDLDADGKSEQIALLKPGSGFLALDRNGDGQINDGSELFGPTLGNGFTELARYDEDGNQFIDENDSIFDKLRIWTRDGQGNEQLVGLGQKGIGAIYLGRVDTPFQRYDQEHQLLGEIAQTGIYLNEDGSSGTLQEVDLVV